MGAQERSSPPLEHPGGTEGHPSRLLNDSGSILHASVVPKASPLGSNFRTFCTCFFISFLKELWDPIFIDFGTILASILELFLVLFSDLWI